MGIIKWILFFSIARALMLDSDFQKARTDMFWALGFVTNLEGMFQSEDYFAEVNNHFGMQDKIPSAGVRLSSIPALLVIGR